VTKYTYDAVGQVKTVTLPDQTVISYGYDDAHRLTDVTDSAGNRIRYQLDNAGNRVGETVSDPGGKLARQISRAYDALNRLETVTGITQ
jgi:YD repeat-containing protein